MIGRLDDIAKLALPILLVVSSGAWGEAQRRSGPPRGRMWLAQDRDGERPFERNRGPGFGGRGGFGMGDGPRQFTDEQLETVLEFIKDHFPERYGEISALREQNPDIFRRRVGRMFPRIMRIMERSERNPQAGELMLEEDRLGLEINRLVEHYYDAEDAGRVADIRREIRELVTRRFEVRQQLREREVRQLERRLEAIRTQLQRDADRREERINDALQELGID